MSNELIEFDNSEFFDINGDPFEVVAAQFDVFGSYVRNEARIDSDLDLLVELDYSKTIGLQFVQMKLDLEQILESKVDLISSKSLSKHILPQVEKEKSLIYAR